MITQLPPHFLFEMLWSNQGPGTCVASTLPFVWVFAEESIRYAQRAGTILEIGGRETRKGREPGGMESWRLQGLEKGQRRGDEPPVHQFA